MQVVTSPVFVGKDKLYMLHIFSTKKAPLTPQKRANVGGALDTYFYPYMARQKMEEIHRTLSTLLFFRGGSGRGEICPSCVLKRELRRRSRR